MSLKMLVATVALLALVPSTVIAQDLDDPPSCQCAALVTTGVLVTALVILAIFGLFLFIRRRTNAGARKPDPEAAAGAAYTNPSYEEDTTDGSRPAQASRQSSASVLQDPASPNNKTRDKGLSTLERVMAAVKLSSRDSPTRTLDDTGNVGGGEEAVVPLRATDFAGLGFTVAGTLRDGIYVKDLLNKGPAALSGNVKPGDRLVALTVVTEHCAQDDALNLLSYASPYPVLLHLVKNSATRQSGLGLNLSTLSSSPSNLSASEKKTSAPAASMPVHPSFRSQSSGDLTSIAPGEDRKASNDLKLRGNIESPHTRISDSAINHLADGKLTRNKMQGRHSERAIDVPETALKPSSAYGKLHPSSHSIQDVVIDIQEPTVPKPQESKGVLGVKVLPDLPAKSEKDSVDIEQSNMENSSVVSEEEPTADESTVDGVVQTAVEVSHSIVEVHSEMNGATINAQSEQNEASVGTKDSSRNNSPEPTAEVEHVSDEEGGTDSSENSLAIASDDSTTPPAVDQVPVDVTEATVTTRSVVREQLNLTQTTQDSGAIATPMLTDDEASRPASEVEAEQSSVLLFSVPEADPHIQAIRPRTDDEKQNARRGLGYEFRGMRNFHLDASAMEESPECDENKIRMDAASSTLSAEVLETANRAAFEIDRHVEPVFDELPVQTVSESVHSDQDIANTSSFTLTNLDLIRNKTDQIKDEEHLAINLNANVVDQQEDNTELENSDTEDDAAMRVSVFERELEPTSASSDETAQLSSQRDGATSRPSKGVAVRRVSSPNDRSNIFGMYVNHDFNKTSDSSVENVDKSEEKSSTITGTKPKTTSSMTFGSRTNQQESVSSASTSNDSFKTAKQFFTTKSEVELTTDLQNDAGENREHSTEKLVTSVFDTRVNLPDEVAETVDASKFETNNEPDISGEKRKISLLNFEISKPKRSTLEIEMKSPEPKDQSFFTYRTIKSDSIDHANEEIATGSPLKNIIESDLPEADSDLKSSSIITRVVNLSDKMTNSLTAPGAEYENVSKDTTPDETEGFGVAFGFKGFKKRIGRGEFVSKNDEENSSADNSIETIATSEPKFISVNDVGKTSVSSLKMSFEKFGGPEEEVQSSTDLQIEDLPESEASFSRTYDSNPAQTASSNVDDTISSHSSEMSEREHLQNEEISLNISRSNLDSDYDTRHGVSDDLKYISSMQENTKEVSKRGNRMGSKNRNCRLSNPEFVSFGNRDEIDQDDGSPKKKLKQSQSFGFKKTITDQSSTTSGVDGRRSSIQENKMTYESRPIPHYSDGKQRIFFENSDRKNAEMQVNIMKSDVEARTLTGKIVSKVNDTSNEALSSDENELLNNNVEASFIKTSYKSHNRQRTPDSADDSDEEMMTLAAAAAVANRKPKSVGLSGVNSRVLKTNSTEHQTTDTLRQYMGSLVTGSVDVEIPSDGASTVEVVETIQAVRIDNDADIVPVSVTGLNPVTISGTFLEENYDSSINLSKEAKDSAPLNMIRIASDYKVLQKSQSHSNFERRATMNDTNVVSIQQIQMKQNGSGSDTENDQITISNTRRSLTDSEELKRKAASLGDLSQIPDRQDESVLERAVSLEFGSTNDHSSSPLHKHRINLPTSSVTSVDEAEEREGLTSQNNPSFDENNKQVTKWGNLEDAIHLRHHTGKESLPNGNGNSVSVQTYRRRDYRASSLEGIPSSVERSNSTKLAVNQPNVTVRSNPTLSMSTVEVPATNLEVNFNAKSIEEIETPEGGPISNIEISGDHGVSITSLSHSASTWVRDGEESPPALPSSPAPINSTSKRDMLGATTIRVLENNPSVDSRVLVVDNNHDYEDQSYMSHSKQKQNSLLKNFINDSESEVTVTTVLGSGKTSFITGSSPPDLVPAKNLSQEGEWVHTNGDVINVSNHDGHNLAHLENNRHESSKGMAHPDRENDSGYLSHPSDPDQIMQMSMTQIRVDGTRLDYGRDDKRLSRTLVIPPPGTSAAICITQPDSPPPFLQPPY